MRLSELSIYQSIRLILGTDPIVWLFSQHHNIDRILVGISLNSLRLNILATVFRDAAAIVTVLRIGDAA